MRSPTTAGAPGSTEALDASAPDASASGAPSDGATSAVAADASLEDAGSPLAVLFDGGATGGPRLAEKRCGPGCLHYPAGWVSTDDSAGMVYAWFFSGTGKLSGATAHNC